MCCIDQYIVTNIVLVLTYYRLIIKHLLLFMMNLTFLYVQMENCNFFFFKCFYVSGNMRPFLFYYNNIIIVIYLDNKHLLVLNL